MGEFIRSALGYFGNSSSANKENELVGQVIEVGKQNFRIKRVIAEGGYAVVFEGIDTTKGKSVAIKRLLAHDEETSKNVLNEIGVLKKLNGDPNIIEFFSAACVGKEKSKHVGTEFLIVTEFCPAELSNMELAAVALYFTDTISTLLERVTTPMYRAPEMLDLYQNYPINEAVDVWALGCLFFYLTCGYHPFGDSAKLAILNANYNLPPCTPETEPFHNLIRKQTLDSYLLLGTCVSYQFTPPYTCNAFY
nr:unnamed protein product [Spirometra erinaceieuropaei]